MTGATIDHLVSVTIFLAAILIFIGLFSQTIQTAILYQQHRYLATKCSDMLDNILLNPGSPPYWGLNNTNPTSFGIQDPEFTEYRLSAFSLMRLNSASGSPVYYPTTGMYYSNVTTGFGEFMLMPLNEVVNYSLAQELLGINNTYGFQLTVTPVITVSITDTPQYNPLTLAINVIGTGFPLANANVSYCLIIVDSSGSYPNYAIVYGTVLTDSKGSASLNLGIDGTQESYVLVAYAHLCGLTGVGYHKHVTDDSSYVIPFVSDFGQREILIAHSRDVLGTGDPAQIAYNATFVLLAEDFTLHEMPMENCTGNVNSGGSYGAITIPTDNPGSLIITYSKNSDESGVVMMPWGISSMAFPIAFGDNPIGATSKEWVATDMRQVIVNDIAYHAKLSLWSLEGYTVVS